MKKETAQEGQVAPVLALRKEWKSPAETDAQLLEFIPRVSYGRPKALEPVSDQEDEIAHSIENSIPSICGTNN
eukprot:5200977-Amphidinium_carterae.1